MRRPRQSDPVHRLHPYPRLRYRCRLPAARGRGRVRPAHYPDADGRLPISVGSFLATTAEHRVLVDLGLGAVDFEVAEMATFRGGGLLDSLAAEGLKPSDIDVVLFTRLDHDHVGWTTDVPAAPNRSASVPAGLTFAPARHLVHPAEWDYWRDREEMVGPERASVLDPLSSTVEFLSMDGDVMPGVRAIASPGHTPGHVSFLISEPGVDDTVFIVGDVMHSQAQISEPDWSFLFDVDPKQATHTRRALLDTHAGSRTTIAGGHIAGRVLAPRRQARLSSIDAAA